MLPIRAVSASHRVACDFSAVDALSAALAVYVLASRRLETAVSVSGFAAVHTFFFIGIMFV